MAKFRRGNDLVAETPRSGGPTALCKVSADAAATSFLCPPSPSTPAGASASYRAAAEECTPSGGSLAHTQRDAGSSCLGAAYQSGSNEAGGGPVPALIGQDRGFGRWTPNRSCGPHHASPRSRERQCWFDGQGSKPPCTQDGVVPWWRSSGDAVPQWNHEASRTLSDLPHAKYKYRHVTALCVWCYATRSSGCPWGPVPSQWMDRRVGEPG